MNLKMYFAYPNLSMNKDIPFYGTVDVDFEKVQTVFKDNFFSKKEIGASCCVYYKGKKVVDIWGGFKDKNKKTAWTEDTLSIVFSTTKGISSLALSLLHSQGLLDFDEKVATYWPEFAFNNKQDITVKQLLAHQAGLYSNDKKLNYEVLIDETKLSDCLAKQKPYWKVGEHRGYHAWTIAMYQNELCKRIDLKKRPLHVFLKEEITDKLNADFFIGLPENIAQERIAELIPFLPTDIFNSEDKNKDLGAILKGFLNPFSPFYKSLLNPPFSVNLNNFNKRKYQALPIGSAMGFGNAKSLAQIYNEFALGTPNLQVNKNTLIALEEAPKHPTKSKKDLVLHVEIPFSLGLAKPSEFQNFGTNYKSYGTFGAGGSGAFADPEKQVAFAYVMNKMGTHIANDPRELALREATYECINALEIKQKNEEKLSQTLV